MDLQYPQLFSFARNRDISVQNFFSQNAPHDLFSLLVSAEAFQQLQMIQSFTEHYPLLDQDDVWTSDWGPFSASKAYKFIIGHRQVPRVFGWLWKSCCQPKHKVFFWLLLKDRLSTRNILKRKNMHLEPYNCVLCSSSDGDVIPDLPSDSR
jgi:hypothetical protein